MEKMIAALLTWFSATVSLAQAPKIEIPDWDNAVRFDLVASQQPVRPGDSFELAVIAEIRDGYHLYGPEEQEPSRTAVAFLGKTLKAGAPSYPPPIERNLEGLGKYHLYEGQIAIRVPVTVPPAPKGASLDASLEVAYQLCTDYACSAPTTKVLSLKVPTAQAGAAVKKLYPDIFKKN